MKKEIGARKSLIDMANDYLWNSY